MSAGRQRATPAVPSNVVPLFGGSQVEGMIVRLKQIAALSGDNCYLSDGPVNADWELLDLCADALHFAKAADRASEHWRGTLPGGARGGLAEKEAYDAKRLAQSELTKRVRRAGKMKATTPAGIYAKAMLVRYGTETAAILAMSLAEDLVECEALRLTLWPAGGAA